MIQSTWLVPFIYLAAMLGLYLFAPKERRHFIQRNMRTAPNFYMGCDIGLIILAIPSTIMWRHAWLDYVTWILMLVLIGISVSRALKPEPPADEVPPPL